MSPEGARRAGRGRRGRLQAEPAPPEPPGAPPRRASPCQAGNGRPAGGAAAGPGAGSARRRGGPQGHGPQGRPLPCRVRPWVGARPGAGTRGHREPFLQRPSSLRARPCMGTAARSGAAPTRGCRAAPPPCTRVFWALNTWMLPPGSGRAAAPDPNSSEQQGAQPEIRVPQGWAAHPCTSPGLPAFTIHSWNPLGNQGWCVRGSAPLSRYRGTSLKF